MTPVHRPARSRRLSTWLLALALLAAAALTPAQAQTPAAGGGTCSAPEAGDPSACNSNEPASQGNSSGVDTGAGNPINVINGNKYQREVDLPALPGELGLEIVRHYNSANRHVLGQLGTGWRLSYETELYRIGQSVQILQADGRRLIFAIDPDNPNQCAGADARQGRVQILGEANARHPRGYIWHWTHGPQAGRQLRFDARGKLVRITAASGAALSLTRGPRGELVQVTDPQGRRLIINHASRQAQHGTQPIFAGIASIDSPLGRFEYRHGRAVDAKNDTELARRQAANLSQVRLPAPEGQAITRRYHYEDARHPQALTGISVRGSGSDGQRLDERIASYRYDARGRATLSVRGPVDADEAGHDAERAGPGQVRLQVLQPALHTRPGRSLLTNSLGGQTLYTHRIIGGEYRLTEAVGVGCARCGPVNIRYQYDEAGRLVEQTTLSPTRVKDGLRQGEPRPLITSRHTRDGQGLRIERIVHGEEGQQPVLTERQAFQDARWPDKPTLIARPSVIAGQEHRIRLTYNAAGQLTALAESGYSPLTEAGEVAATPQEATPIQRSTSYTYARINGRSVLARVDGPLANGPTNSPTDSDITELQWDERGRFVIQVTHPGGATTTYNRDDSGRTVQARSRDGYRQMDVQTEHVAWPSFAMQPNRVTRVAHLLADGQPVPASRLEDAPLQQASGAALAHLRANLDQDALEPEVQWQRPSASAQAMQTRLSTRDASDADVNISRDALGRPVSWQTEQRTLLQASWGSVGTAAQSLILTLDSANGQAQRRVDDFGRVVAIRSPGVDWQTAQYDAADRITRIIDARGAVQAAQYAPSGQLLRIGRTMPGALAPGETTALHWQGNLLHELTVVDAEGERRIRYRHDALGQLSEEVQQIALTGHTPVSFAIRHERSPDAERITLQDAHGPHSTVMKTQDDRGRVTGMRVSTGHWPDVGSTLIQSVDWTRVSGSDYAQGITWGNGRSESWPVQGTPEQAGLMNASLQSAEIGVPGRGASALARPGWAHDSAGLPGIMNTAAGRLQLEWDAAARLKSIAQGASREHFIYDARGRRVAKRIGQDIRYFAWDGVQLAGEADAQGVLRTRYAYLGWRPVAQIVRRQGHWVRLQTRFTGPEVQPLETSRSGRVLAMYGSDGTLLWRDPQSHEDGALPSGAIHQPLRDVGQYADDESGLIYHVARFFDPQTDLFLSPDPQGIADTLIDTRSDLLLNAYAYAGGNPQMYFDPDGAAKLTYYAITTGATGSHFTPQQGFTVARWAFTITDVSGGGAGTDIDSGILFDGGGNFLKELSGGISNPTGTTVRWDTQADADTILQAFEQHYGDDRIVIREFEFEDFDDASASALIDYLMRDAAGRKACEASAPGWLPEIQFAEEEAAIQVTSASSGNAKKQRILACGEGSDQDIDLRRIAKFQAAAEINETMEINRDCSIDGCPGIGYYCDAAKCYLPRDQLRYGPPKTQEPVYTPSYGRSQFIGTTLVYRLIKGYDSLSEPEKTGLGLTIAIKQSMEDALARGKFAANWYENTKPHKTFADANNAWANLSEAEQQRFILETGLGEREYIDIARMKTQPPRNSNGKILSRDAEASFATTAIMVDINIENIIMDIFKNFDKFTVMAHSLMRVNIEEAIGSSAFDKTEEHLAAMVARAHNGGPWSRDINELKRRDANDYVKRFLGFLSEQGSSGDWSSLRCTELFGGNTVRPGTLGKGIGGLQMQPMELN